MTPKANVKNTARKSSAKRDSAKSSTKKKGSAIKEISRKHLENVVEVSPAAEVEYKSEEVSIEISGADEDEIIANPDFEMVVDEEIKKPIS